LFWPIWITITLLGILLVTAAVPRKGQTISPDLVETSKPHWSLSTILALTFLGLFLVFYVTGFLVWEDFAYYDNSHFTNGTLVGQNVAIQILPWNGRFWPMGHQEFNVIRHFTHSVAGYHALRIVELLLICGILLLFDQELSIRSRAALVFLVLIAPSIVTSFNDLIYAEANIVFLFLCLAWFVKRFGETRSIAWAIGAVIASQLLLYYKETAFILLLGFAIGHLLLRCWDANRAEWDWKRLREPESRLDICLGCLVVPFWIYYLAAMYPNFGMGYANQFHLRLSQVVSTYIDLDLPVWLLAVTALVRAVLILSRRVTPSPVWDGLAAGSACFFAGYLALRMQSAYFLAPVDLVAILYLGRLVILSINGMGAAARLSVIALATVIVVQDLSLSAFRMYERKNVIHAKVEMAKAIKARYDSDPDGVNTLFFPSTSPYNMMEFASYLNYVGVPVERTDTPAATDIRMVGRKITKEGPCGYRAFVCHPGTQAEPGDLVAVLPDDLTSTGAPQSDEQEGSGRLFSYAPAPSIPPWARSYVGHLHVISPELSQTQLPNSWLNASLTIWK
jgi:hypothetical protein